MPTRDTVRGWLSDLAFSRVTREHASELASPWTSDSEAERAVTDSLLYVPLSRLAGADLKATPDAYLYGPSDFEEWVTDFEVAVQSAPPV